MTRKDALDLLEHDLRSSPRSEREVFELYYVEGKEPEEIEATTEYPLQTVQQNLAAVRQKLLERLQPQEATT